MDFVKFLPHALIIGILAAILQFVSMVPGMENYVFPWAVFQTWALYFLSGANPKAGAKSVVCGVVGVLASMLIVVMGTKLASRVGAQMGFTLAVLVVATLCIMMEKVPPISFIPAYFIAAGIFFALALSAEKYSMNMRLAQVSISLVLGFGLGFLTVLLRGKYAAMIAAPARENNAK